MTKQTAKPKIRNIIETIAKVSKKVDKPYDSWTGQFTGKEETLDYEQFKNFTGIVTHENGYGFFKNGLLHRADGPALVRNDGAHEYFFDGEHVPKGTLRYTEILIRQTEMEEIRGFEEYDEEVVDEG